MNNEELQKLKELAQVATPGPWTVCRHLESVEADAACTCGYRGTIYGPDDYPMSICQPGHDPDPVGEEGMGPQNYPRVTQIANAKFIAAANPAAILELIEIAEGATSPAPAVVQMTDEQINRIVLDVAELPDRDSPPDQPEMMLVSAEELRVILSASGVRHV